MAIFKSELMYIIHAEAWSSGFAKRMLKFGGDDIVPEVKKSLMFVAGHKEHFTYRLRIFFSPKFRTGDIRLTLLGKLRALLGVL